MGIVAIRKGGYWGSPSGLGYRMMGRWKRVEEESKQSLVVVGGLAPEQRAIEIIGEGARRSRLVPLERKGFKAGEALKPGSSTREEFWVVDSGNLSPYLGNNIGWTTGTF
ncbi:hypothetical protein SRHO_G00171580 [Serrasalmus rhombeus]